MASGGQPLADQSAPEGSPGPAATPDSSDTSTPAGEPTTTEPTVASVPPEEVDSEADPAFDPLLPTLGQTTNAPIMLPADLRYMEPKEGELVNQGPFWEGSFGREGHVYVLRVPLDDPSGDIARRALSSMVEVADSSGPGTEDLAAQAEAAAGEYYRAAGMGDWAYTYENLDSETRALFTEGEWFAKNQWFADSGSVVYHIESAERLGTSSGIVVEVSLRLTYGDGTSSTRTTYFVQEGGAWKHSFGQEEHDLFMPEASYEEFVAAQ